MPLKEHTQSGKISCTFGWKLMGMKKILFGFCCLIFVNQMSTGQSFLNGSFEITTAGCTGNISNATFNSLMADVKAIGNLEMISIFDTSLGCGSVQDGIHSINIMHISDPLVIDVVSLRLTDSVYAGFSYTISFYHYYVAVVLSDSIEIGVSDNDSTFGTIAGISPMITNPGTWVQRIVNFTAPITGNFVTVRPRYFPAAAFNYLDNFTLTATTSVNDFQSSTFNFQIFPNPVKNFINISLPSTEKNMRVEIFDLFGRKVFEKEGVSKIDMRSFWNGVYFIKVNTDGNSIVQKIVKM